MSVPSPAPRDAREQRAVIADGVIIGYTLRARFLTDLWRATNAATTLPGIFNTRADAEAAVRCAYSQARSEARQ